MLTTVSFAALPPVGTPTKPQSVVPTGLLDIEQVNYANGVKVLLWPTEDDPGRVTVKVRWGAGWRAFSAQDAAYAQLGDRALVGSGMSELGQEEIDRIATGRKMGFNFEIGLNSRLPAIATRPALHQQLVVGGRPALVEHTCGAGRAQDRLVVESQAVQHLVGSRAR